MSGGPVRSLLGGAFRYWQVRQATVANNVANASTDGYRGERVFARLLEGASAPVAESGIDLRRGSLTRTDNPLDVALEGDGFLVVETERGNRLTRGGSLSVDASGFLVDSSGHPVVGESGRIAVPHEGELAIDRVGEVTVDGELVGRLRLERLPRGVDPLRQGETHFLVPGGVETEPDEETTVRQGHVESSNVDPVGSMVEMMEVRRAYASLERSARSLDQMMDTISNRLSRVD